MYKAYSKYKSTDFLTDEYFIDSMQNPTPESEIFWKKLIVSGEIDADEFISAYNIISELKKNKPEVPTETLDKLWLRILQTNKRKRRKSISKKIYAFSVAASILVILGSIFNFKNNVPEDKVSTISEFARENIIHQHDNASEIVVITSNKKISVEGNQAELEYDADGTLKLNTKEVTVNKPNDKDENLSFNQLSVPFGKRAFLKLSDGTSLWINTGTTVIYPSAFSDKKREIFVEGEVYAEVAHDSKRPFIIKTDKLDVQVLGTVFNLTAYKKDNHTNVVLVSGSVNVKPINGQATIMKPNQLYSLNNESTTIRNVDVENYISWRDGLYIFKNEPIENILLHLARYYNVTMKLPSSPSGINCSGKLELKDDLVRQLNGLSEIVSMNYSVKNNEYKISFNQ